MPERTRSEWVITNTEAIAPHVMVTADRAVAVDAALGVLHDGGNAVDAAVTAAFVMGVAEPALSGIGGVAAMVIRDPDGREAVIDGSGLTPRAARPDMFDLESTGGGRGMYGWPAVVGDENNVGYRSVGVPGMVAAMSLALERFGTIDLRRAVQPAVALARGGVPLDIHLTNTFATYADRLWRYPGSKRTYFKEDGRPLHPPTPLEGGGDRLVLADLARSLEEIGRHGAPALYRGELAHVIVDEVRANGGLLDLEDLASYRPRELDPLVTQHRGHRLATLPGCGGGITLVEALNILDGLDLRSVPRTSARFLHLLAEAQRAAFADRFALLADPDQVDAPFALLASMEHADRARSSIDPFRVSDRPSPRVPAGVPADVPHTTHISVVDASRMCVALTSTLGRAFGSAAVLGDTGVVLANVMTWFDPRPGRINSIAGSKRILWAPSPAIASSHRSPRLVVGGSGGRRLISGVLQAILNVVDHEDGAEAALNAWRIHDEGSGTLVDTRIPSEVQAELASMGHTVAPTDDTIASPAFGRINAIVIESDRLRGGVTRLRPSVAAGY